MNIADERKAIEAALDTYRAELDRIPDGQFAVTPPGGVWSYAEVYSHIMQATLGATIAAEKCSADRGKPTNKKSSILGKLVLFFGRFPPVKVKTPKVLATAMPVSNISKEDARNFIIKCRRRVDTIVPLVHDAPDNFRVGHPRFGMLNAGQWLKFIRIHLQHHLRQLQRNDKAFAKQA
jgi:hypothetical protein